MAVPGAMKDISTTASSNSPAGSENPISTDDFHRAIQAILRHTNAKGSDIASGSSIDLGAATGEFVDVTGTTTITALGTIVAGIVRTVRFTGALTLTHNATSLILPTGANITTANGDVAMFRSLGSGNWKCVNYIKQDGTPLALPTSTVTLTGTQTLTNKTLTSPVITASTATVAADDKVLILDTNDADNTKTVTAQAIADLSTITLETSQATTSGTSKTFSSIPAGVKRITVMFVGVSTNGTSPIQVRLGDAGGVETSGYAHTVFDFSSVSSVITNGFQISRVGAAAGLFNGTITLSLVDASTFTWVASVNIGRSDAADAWGGGGSKSLSAALTQIEITTSGGTDAFDAGLVNISYK